MDSEYKKCTLCSMAVYYPDNLAKLMGLPLCMECTLYCKHIKYINNIKLQHAK